MLVNFKIKRTINFKITRTFNVNIKKLFYYMEMNPDWAIAQSGVVDSMNYEPNPRELLGV